MSPHPLTNFEIQKYYQNEHKFNGVCSINTMSMQFKVMVLTCLK